MKIYSFIFADSPPVYTSYARALSRSFEVNAPNTPFEILTIRARDADIYKIGRGRPNAYVQNTRKTRHQQLAVAEAPLGELLGFVDLDMIALKELKPISDIWFDFAHTLKPVGSPLRLNTGVTFCRVNEKTRKFYTDWLAFAIELLADKHLHKNYSTEYGGINQSSLARLFQSEHGLEVAVLDSAEWNCTQDTAETVQSKAKLVHMLRDFRKTTRHKKLKFDNPNVQWVAERWRKYHEESKFSYDKCSSAKLEAPG